MNGEINRIGPAPLPDNQANQGAAGGQPPIPPASQPPAGPPPPPPPPLDVRTMSSDTESLKASGGLGPEPRTFRPADLAKGAVFEPQPAPVAPRSRQKVIWLGLGIVAFLVVAGLVIYFFVLPLFSPSQPPAETVTPPVEQIPAPPPPPPPAPQHQTYFVKPVESSGVVTLAGLTPGQIASSLQPLPADILPTGSIKEFYFTFNGTQVGAGDFLAAMLPSLNLADLFESDFTGFLYFNASSSWPGYVFKLKAGVDPKIAAGEVAKLEGSPGNLLAFYLADPGKPATAFKNGKVGTLTTRYLGFSQKGASFNYGWFKDYLIVSTSFDGFKKAVSLLQ
jgi:hypothetical protein